jgi:heme peroxidase
MPTKKIKKAGKGAKKAKPAATNPQAHAFMAKVREAFRFHGGQPRGSDFPPESALFEGRFGRMFRTLPPAEFDENDLRALATMMIADHEDVPTPETQSDDEENRGISAGYTYLGQFIDHDLTFDPASSLDKQNDPDALEDFRTPRFDLDSVYGRGPNDQPYLYEDNGVRMLLGEQLTGSVDHEGKVDEGTRDLPRNNPHGGRARALIGDPRNDENVIVSQLHATMLRFHNSVVDYLTRTNGGPPKIEEVQNVVRWHYQWVVLHDFLPTIAGQKVIQQILPHLKKKNGNIRVQGPRLTFFHFENFPFMPIEFSAAAYRFGHSMVRPIYRLNTTLIERNEIFSADESKSLTGFRALPSDFAVDWRLFFKTGENTPSGAERLQKSYKIDTSLVNPLGNLPKVIGDNHPSLAERNLIRGLRMSLPSGQTVARYMGLPVIPDEKLRVGKATKAETKKNPPLTERRPSLKENAPLWYYILAEAQQAFKNDATTIRLGPVGGRIVAEVFIGLLLGDQRSFLSQYPSWRPIGAFTTRGKFGIAELIKQAQNA